MEKSKLNVKNVIAGVALVIVTMIAIFGIVKAGNKIAYQEYTNKYFKNVESIEADNPGFTIVQKFKMPYDIVNGISIRLDNYTSAKNTAFDLQLIDVDNNKIIIEKSLVVKNTNNDKWFNITFSKTKVKKDSNYELKLYSNEVNRGKKLVFYKTEEISKWMEELFVNGLNLNGNLCFSISGGSIDYWWYGYILFILLYVYLIICRITKSISEYDKIYDDKIMMGLLLGGLYALLMNIYSCKGQFIDEFDNIRGGMIIANGGILYKDYVVQHTPLMYYLCSAFSILHAVTLQEFRICYYIFVAMIWTMLYIRHSDSFGSIKIGLVIITNAICIPLIDSFAGHMILSDSMEGIFLVMLILELMRYWKTSYIGWKEAFIISIGIWGCLGVAFVSAFSLLWIVVSFFFSEIKLILTDNKGVKLRIKFYYKLFAALIVIALLFVLYFNYYDALLIAYEQFYVFNREVYPRYTGGYGYDILGPFKQSLIITYEFFKQHINLLLAGKLNNTQVLRFVVLSLAIVINTLLAIKKDKRYLFLLLIMLCAATRGYGFHGMPAWIVAITVIIMNVDKLISIDKLVKVGIPQATFIIIFCLLFSNCMANRNTNGLLRLNQAKIDDCDSYVTSCTDNNERIMIDATCHDCIYLLYKNRYPVNKAVYMLPWYMEWFEKDNIKSLNDDRPNIVVYNEDTEVWKRKHFMKMFPEVLKENYIRLSDNPKDGWKYYIWKRKINL